MVNTSSGADVPSRVRTFCATHVVWFSLMPAAMESMTRLICGSTSSKYRWMSAGTSFSGENSGSFRSSNDNEFMLRMPLKVLV